MASSDSESLLSFFPLRLDFSFSDSDSLLCFFFLLTRHRAYSSDSDSLLCLFFLLTRHRASSSDSDSLLVMSLLLLLCRWVALICSFITEDLPFLFFRVFDDSSSADSDTSDDCFRFCFAILCFLGDAFFFFTGGPPPVDEDENPASISSECNNSSHES